VSVKFADELEKYVVLKLALDKYKGTTRTLEAGFQIAGSEVRERIRKDEKRLLKLYFCNWVAPYYGNLKDWRDESPIYVLYQGRLVSGLYLCGQNEFDEEKSWGQVHYFFTDPAFKGTGLHSILFSKAIDRAKSWNLQGVIISTDRYLLPKVYVEWGAIPWKEVKKVNSWMPLTPSKKFLELLRKLIRTLGRRL